MLTNKDIAAQLDLVSKLMELHDENPFKSKAYASAALSLRKLEGSIAALPAQDIAAIRGVGSTIADKIEELLSTGGLQVLKDLKAKTPEGIHEMLRIKGLGPKKVQQIWHEMGILTVGELLYACTENRLVHYRGFGLKAQDELRRRIEYYMDSRGRFLYSAVEDIADAFLLQLRSRYPDYTFFLCGDLRRKLPEVCGIEILTDAPEPVTWQDSLEEDEFSGPASSHKGVPVFLYYEKRDHLVASLYARSAGSDFLAATGVPDTDVADEMAFFHSKGLPFFPPECRELAPVGSAAYLDKLIDVSHLKGIIHAHSTYSDGLHSLEEMAMYVMQQGYSYFVISDHSRSAGYAGGLSIENVLRQWAEIDALNTSFNEEFKIFKSIESDILTDGSLDYPDDFLNGFDLVIASVHSALSMDEQKATTRLIKAIEHPATRILGHPTGRLLLARKGYPVDYKKVIDACVANGVAMELNANPQRLDMDWTWIPYGIEKGLTISINPDAHSKESIHFVRYGVTVARKGLLPQSSCLNALDVHNFSRWLTYGS